MLERGVTAIGPTSGGGASAAGARAAARARGIATPRSAVTDAVWHSGRAPHSATTLAT